MRQQVLVWTLVALAAVGWVVAIAFSVLLDRAEERNAYLAQELTRRLGLE